MKRLLVGVVLVAVVAIVVGIPYLLVPRDDEPREEDLGFECNVQVRCIHPEPEPPAARR